MKVRTKAHEGWRRMRALYRKNICLNLLKTDFDGSPYLTNLEREYIAIHGPNFTEWHNSAGYCSNYLDKSRWSLVEPEFSKWVASISSLLSDVESSLKSTELSLVDEKKHAERAAIIELSYWRRYLASDIKTETSVRVFNIKNHIKTLELLWSLT